MTNLDSIWKSRDMTLLTKVHLVKAMVYPVVMYGCESWTREKAEHRGIDAFKLWCWRRFWRLPWIVRWSNQSVLKEVSLEHSLEGLMLKLKLQYWWPWGFWGHSSGIAGSGQMGNAGSYWTREKAEHRGIDAFKLWCWRRFLRVPWTAKRYNQSILKEISPEYSLERLMLKRKLQYFEHLMQRTDFLEKTLMLGKIESRRRGGRQRLRHHLLNGHEFE